MLHLAGEMILWRFNRLFIFHRTWQTVLLKLNTREQLDSRGRKKYEDGCHWIL